MLAEIEKAWLTDLLTNLELCDLMELARTSTNGIIVPSNINDCLNAILLHTPDVRSLLLRKKITRVVLFKYLHSKNISFPGSAEKGALIELVIQFWQKPISKGEAQDASGRLAIETSTSRIVSTSNPTTGNTLELYELKVLAVKFAEWFYNRLNAIVMCKLNYLSSGPTYEKLKEEDFWCDAKISVKLLRGTGELIADYSSANSKDCLELISKICIEHSLFFSPNLREEGIRSSSEPHGLVLVMNCGTLHSTKGHQCVGLYEQVFGLIKDPFGDNWKIKVSKLSLRSQEVNSVPTLLSDNQLSIKDV